MSPALTGVLTGGILAVGLTAAWAPALAAMRVREVVKVAVGYPNVDVLDAGERCLYTWEARVFVFKKPAAGVGCPPQRTAKAMWQKGQDALVRYVELTAPWTEISIEGDAGPE